jgi:hypothetical protein
VPDGIFAGCCRTREQGDGFHEAKYSNPEREGEPKLVRRAGFFTR